MKIVKLDKRHKGHTWFKYAVEYTHSKDITKFVEHRAWAWTTFGSSCELKFWEKAGKAGDRWCWCADEWNTRIYLFSEAELNWLKMAHGVGV